jgi:hypothetical protein
MLLGTYKKAFLFLFILLIIIGPFLALSFFCHPLPGDDYHFALRAMTIGSWNTLVESYVEWTGRYFLCGILSINPLIFDSLITYQFSIFAMILAFPVIAYFLFRTYLKTINSIKHIQFTVLLSFLYFYSLPNLNEGLFWFTGAIAYQFSNILWMLYLIVIGFILQPGSLSKALKAWLVFSAILLIVMISGCNEISMAVLLIFNIIVCLKLFISNSDKKYTISLLVFISMIASFVVIAAPGNAIRTSLFPDNHNFVITIYMSFLGGVYYLMQWLFMTLLISIYVIYVFDNKFPKSNNIFNVSPIFSLCILGILLAVGFIVPAWATGQMPNARAINVIFMFFVIGWLYNLMVLINYYNNKGTPIPIMHRNYLIAITATIFLITFNPSKIVNNNIKYAYMSFASGKAQEYNKEMDRYLKDVKKSDAMIYPNITAKPYCLYQEIELDSLSLKEVHAFYKIKSKKF